MADSYAHRGLHWNETVYVFVRRIVRTKGFHRKPLSGWIVSINQRDGKKSFPPRNSCRKSGANKTRLFCSREGKEH